MTCPDRARAPDWRDALLADETPWPPTGPRRSIVAAPTARGSAPALAGPTRDADRPASGTEPRDVRVPVLRAARERLRDAATTRGEALEHALRAFLTTAYEAGFGATTACSVACAAILDGLPPLPRRKAEGRALEYYLHVRGVYVSLTS